MTIQFNFIGVVVDDFARSFPFYRMLGLDLPVGAESEDHVEVELPGGLKLAFDTPATVTSFNPTWSPAPGGRISLAFACSDADQVDRTYGELVDAGYHGHKEPWDAFWGQRYALVHDPDGNGIELYAPLAAA